MSGGLPDVHRAHRADHGRHKQPTRRGKEDGMVLIQVKLIQGVFTAPQKREIAERLTDAMVAIEGEPMRNAIWCLIEEVASDEWAVGGHTLARG
jgi:4-oxalocrotonate tautomerase